jgi:TolB-like protein
MKNWFLPFLVVMLAGCGSSPKAESPSVQGISVDTAIQQAARNIENNVDAGRKVVVLNFSSSSVDFSEYVLGELSTELVNGRKLQVVDRRNLEAIRAEMDFQMSGEVSDESAQAIGRKLGAEYIISGSLTNTGGIYRFRINTINVESAGIAASSATDITNDSKVQVLLSSGGGGATSSGSQRVAQGGASAQTGRSATVPAAPSAPAYKIGDIGPAGGIVFYDKGNNSGGWRYLEAAPAETEEKLNWLSKEVEIDGTKTELGTGKKNTQLITADLSIGVPEAALHCVELEYGGFHDWFLPSKDELNLMYVNLKRKNLGDFADELYWSSSESYYMQFAWAGPGDGWMAWVQNFKDASQSYGYLNRSGRSSVIVRAIRQF